MTLPRWDDDMKFELLRLKNDLKAENFRALHNPIGLRPITRKSETKIPRSISPMAPVSVKPPSRFRPETLPTGLSPDLPQRAHSKSFSRLLVIHALDIAFVLLTIGLGLLLATWVIDPKHISKNPVLLKQAAPLLFLTKSNAFALVALLYGFFSLYWLFFKLVTGSTLGESFLDNFRTLQNPRRQASAKDSGDS
ncbi:MAG: hypothetical protein EOP10_11295 [Proteobacteria bacterium]|nr:MAG: hypothetical protein EOP10_11295 [Pseudomonadota bacterium]